MICKVCLLEFAALKFTLPTCKAVMSTEPALKMVTVLFMIDTIDGSLEEKVTGKLDVEDAVNEKGWSPKVFAPMG